MGGTLQLIPSSYVTAEEILVSDLSEANVFGEITTISFDQGAGIIVLDNILPLHLAMSSPKSAQIMSGEYSTLRATIEKVGDDWIIVEVHGE